MLQEPIIPTRRSQIPIWLRRWEPAGSQPSERMREVSAFRRYPVLHLQQTLMMKSTSRANPAQQRQFPGLGPLKAMVVEPVCIAHLDELGRGMAHEEQFRIAETVFEIGVEGRLPARAVEEQKVHAERSSRNMLKEAREAVETEAPKIPEGKTEDGEVLVGKPKARCATSP